MDTRAQAGPREHIRASLGRARLESGQGDWADLLDPLVRLRTARGISSLSLSHWSVLEATEVAAPGAKVRPGAVLRRPRRSNGRGARGRRLLRTRSEVVASIDPETGVVPGVTRDRKVRSSRRCSMCPAIHITSRSWLRSSSTHVPSDPPLRVVSCSLSRAAARRYNMPRGSLTVRFM